MSKNYGGEKKCPTPVVHYIDEFPLPTWASQFAKDAAAHGKCTMSLFFGHTDLKLVPAGPKDRVSFPDPKDPKKLVKPEGPNPDAVKEAFKNIKEAQNQVPGQNPCFGIFGCDPRKFNAAIPEKNRVADPASFPDKPIPYYAVAIELNDKFANIEKKLRELCRCCNNEVHLHLYFGMMNLSNPKTGKKAADNIGNW
jgi:hypothetical protein